jgi:hypothetical protein
MHPSTAALREQVTELYFPGGHGGVGGGSAAEVPLAENALHFLIHEMGRRNLKLEFDTRRLSQGFVNVPPTRYNERFLITLALGGRYVRPIRTVDDCHLQSVATRFQMQPNWRPPALRHLEHVLLQTDIGGFQSR